MIVFKRKQAIAVVVVCMILIAGYINWAYRVSPPVGGDTVASTQDMTNAEIFGRAEMVNAPVASQDVIAAARETRDTARNKSIELLRATADSPSAGADEKKAALSELTAIASAVEKEGVCEGMIETKVGRAVVFISGENVSVSLETNGELTDADVAKAVDVIVTNTGISADKIKVSAAK